MIVVSLILARAENGVIGANGKLPWHISADLKQFKALTVGKPVIMGRKTYESIGKPLPRRTNIVVTRNAAWHADGVMVATDLPTALALGYEDAHRTGVDEVMVIGGAEIYTAALSQAKRIYLTEVHRAYDGDARFPFDFAGWREISRVPLSEGEIEFSFVVLGR
ncbi:MAG: dihydrofolate reductase [Alphaproteobacteria bacterium]|nr:dihydrofolate reductase [Alphaproteobacteria bacterium]